MGRRPVVKYVGIDWAYRMAQWCALAPGGEIVGEGRVAADRDGLARLALELGVEVKACLEMMSGALWVRDELVSCGWQVEVADARKVKTVAPLAAKTDKVDARLLADLCRRQLLPALWLPALDERALRERLRRRTHLVRLRTSAKARIAGLQTQWGVRVSLARLRRADGLALLEHAGVPAVWCRSVERVSDARRLSRCADRAARRRAETVRPRRPARGPARHDPRRRRAARPHDRRRDRRGESLLEPGQTRFLRSTRPTRPPVGSSSAVQRPTQQVRLTPARLGGGRGRPAGLARNEPLARPLHRRRAALPQQQRRQGRGRAQDPDRRLAHALPQQTLHARPSLHRGQLCPGKLPLGFGRLTAPYGTEKPGQLPSTRCASNAKKEMSLRRPANEEVNHQRRLDTRPFFRKSLQVENGLLKGPTGPAYRLRRKPKAAVIPARRLERIAATVITCWAWFERLLSSAPEGNPLQVVPRSSRLLSRSHGGPRPRSS